MARLRSFPHFRANTLLLGIGAGKSRLAAESGPGRFTFTWAGKHDAIGLIRTPSRGTLVPCPEESINGDDWPARHDRNVPVRG